MLQTLLNITPPIRLRENALQLWKRLGHGMGVFATVNVQAEGPVWLALSHLILVCVGILIKLLLLALLDDGKQDLARVLI